MPLFNNTYSGLITKGLGLPACCGLITMGFGLFRCTIDVIPIPPTSGGGGGGGVSIRPGINVPFRQTRIAPDRIIRITVGISDKKWSRAYTVDRSKAAIVVRVVNVVNSLHDRVSVNVSKLSKIVRKITATISGVHK